MKNKSNFTDRPPHKGYPGSVLIKTVGDWGIAYPSYPTAQEYWIAQRIMEAAGNPRDYIEK